MALKQIFFAIMAILNQIQCINFSSITTSFLNFSDDFRSILYAFEKRNLHLANWQMWRFDLKYANQSRAKYVVISRAYRCRLETLLRTYFRFLQVGGESSSFCSLKFSHFFLLLLTFKCPRSSFSCLSS